jgi:hypothetical protein
VVRAGRGYPGVGYSLLLRGYFLRNGVERLVLSVWRSCELFQRCFFPRFLVVP